MNNFLRYFLFLAVLLSLRAAAASPAFASAVTNGTVNFSGLSEASGVVASRDNSNVLYTHNDSGHPAIVFAIDTQGRLLGSYTLPGNQDNEDIAIGPGPIANISYLYVGDIGDNGASRANIKVYQIPEPAVYASQYTNPVTSTPKGSRTITLTYADGPRDAESMFVDPLTGDLFILSKESTSRIYTAPKAQLDTNNNITLSFVRSLSFNVPSGADISAAGNEIVVRQENLAQLWTRTNGQSVSNAFGGTPVSIPVTGTGNGEPNGEAIGFDAIGSGYFTMSDDATTQPLRYFARSSHDGPLEPTVLVPAGSTWKYRDNGSDQGLAWRLSEFDDAGWAFGTAQFGYGEGDEQTVVGFGGNANNKYITTYFRKAFTVFNAAGVSNLVLKLVVDDGAAVFLNGTAVVSENLTGGAGYNTLATAMPVALQSAWHSYALDSRLLAEGTNTLAVEVHQSSPAGTNISFDLQLVALTPGFYEPFNYATGSALALLTNAAGQWWSAAGPAGSTSTVVSASLTVPGLAASHGGAMQFGAVTGPSARFNLLSNVVSGTLYFSCALKVTSLGALASGGSWFGGFNNSRGTQSGTPTVFGTRLLARATGSQFNLGVAKDTTNAAEFVWSSSPCSVDETVFLAGSYTFNTGSGSDDVASLWINPNPSNFGSNNPPPPTLTAATGTDISAAQLASFVLLQRGLNNANQPGAVVVDELRIGPTWASVTPPAIIQPRLLANQVGSAVVLSWPTNSAGFLLETTATLNVGALWTNPLLPVFTSTAEFRATNNTPSGTAFYRLSRAP